MRNKIWVHFINMMHIQKKRNMEAAKQKNAFSAKIIRQKLATNAKQLAKNNEK